jgi:hypothetical protein
MQRLRGAAPLDYLSEVIRTGGASDQGIGSELRQGDLIAVVPPNTSEQRVMQFNAGGLLPAGPVRVIGGTSIQEVPTSVSTLAKVVSDRVRTLEDPVLWIHEPMLVEGALKSFLGDEIDSQKIRCQEIEGQLYLAYSSDIRAEMRIAQAINSSMLSWHFLAFVTDRVHQVSSVSELLKQAKMILVGAYDGESALIWERRS